MDQQQYMSTGVRRVLTVAGYHTERVRDHIPALDYYSIAPALSTHTQMIRPIVTLGVVLVAIVQAKNLDNRHQLENHRADRAPNARPHRQHSTASRADEPKLTFRDNIEHYGKQFSQNIRNFRLPKPIAYQYRKHHLAKRSLDSNWLNQTGETHGCDIKPMKPEVLLLLDHELYKKYGDRTGEFGKSFLNAMQKVLEGIPCPEIKLHLSAIADSPRYQMPFIKNNMLAHGKVNIDSAIMNLSRYVYENNYQLPKNDLVMQLVDGELCQTTNGYTDCRLLGSAFTGGACQQSRRYRQYNSLIVVRESGGYDSVKAAIHQLLHLMSARHDDNPYKTSKSSGCPSSDNFIMDYGNTLVDYNSGNINQFKLSPCTIEEIRSFMKKSSSKCLLNDPPASSALSPDDYYILSADEQCRFRHGNGSKACVLSCTALGCTNDNMCSYMNPPMEGTPCDGNTGNCRLGICENNQG